MEPYKETQWKQPREGGVGDLLNKINHAVKSSRHFKCSLSSVINSNTAPPDGDGKPAISNHRAKQISVSSSKRGDIGSSSQGVHSSKTLHNSSLILTMTPDYDGYQWRKYGEKKIANSKFPRSYYKCTYHSELNCKATKHVQQYTDEDNSTMYKVTYFNKHNCDDISFRNIDATSDCQKMLDFSVKETSTINPQVQQLASCSDGCSSVVDSSTNNLEISDRDDQTESESMDQTDLIWHEQYDLEELLSEIMYD